MIHDPDEAKERFGMKTRTERRLLTSRLRVKRLPNSPNKSADSYKSLRNEVVTERRVDPAPHSDFYCVRKTGEWGNLEGRSSDGAKERGEEER